MSHYEIEMKVKLKLVYKDTAWVTHALENCIDSEEQVEVETIKEEYINNETIHEQARRMGRNPG